jgi:hypothetical protein
LVLLPATAVSWVRLFSPSICLCRYAYTQVSLMLLLSKLQSFESGEHHRKNEQKSRL